MPKPSPLTINQHQKLAAALLAMDRQMCQLSADVANGISLDRATGMERLRHNLASIRSELETEAMKQHPEAGLTELSYF